MDKLHFELRPSLTKMGISVGLFILLNAIVSNYIGGIAFGLVMLLCLVILYFVSDRNPVQQLAQLDQNIWSIQRKDESIEQLEMLTIYSFGSIIFIKFQRDNLKKITLAITKDQLDLTEWKQLNTLVKLS